MTEKDGWIKAPIWDEWLTLTRLQWSGRIAFQAEVERWHSPYISGKDGISVRISDCGAKYTTSLKNHLETIEDHTHFCALILNRSYSLLESHSKLATYIVENGNWSAYKSGVTEDEQDEVDKIELKGGIKSWANDLLRGTGQSWSQVYGGRKGLVEVSIVRNALAHGYSKVTPHLLARAAASGCSIPFAVGEPISIDFALLHEYRGRMRSFCRIISDGVVLKYRGRL